MNQKIFLTTVYILVFNVILYSQSTRDTINYESGKLYVSFRNPHQLNIANQNTSDGFYYTTSESLNSDLRKFRVNAIDQFVPLAPKESALNRIYIMNCNCNEVELMDRLKENKLIVEYAERVPKGYIDDVQPFIPNDYSINDLWHLERIETTKAWSISKDFISVPIAIVDTGYDTLHVDLIDQIVFKDGNVWCYSPTDRHGTSTAGIASMTTNNGIGYSSIGGFNTKLLLYRGWTYAQMFSKLYPAAVNGAKVINASWSSKESAEAEQLLINDIYQMGVVIVASGSTLNQCKYPACYDHVIAVAGTDRNDIKHSDTGYYPELDISAPAEDIMTTKPGNLYGVSWATSAAAPIVTGVCGMILSVNPSYNPDEVAHIVKSTIDSIYHLQGNEPYIGMLGTGRINAYKAVRKAASLHFQNVSLTGTKTFNCTYDAYFGSNVINPINQGNVIIVSGSNITVNADEFYLEPGFEVQLGGMLTIQ